MSDCLPAFGGRSLQSMLGSLMSVPASIEVDDVSLDSRQTRPNGVFLACRGRRTHGLQGLTQALAQGVRAVLWEPAAGVDAPDVEALQRSGVFAAPLADLSRHASAIAANFFESPSEHMRVHGITGTNGKTTTAWLLAQGLECLGLQGAYIGTLGAGRVGGEIAASALTTADAVTVQRQLAELRAQGAQQVAMEVSSHALDQYRVEAVRFRVAVFTNLSRDHLDYHGSMQAYGACKARLFAWPGLEAQVINVDDEFGRGLVSAALDTPECAAALLLVCRTEIGKKFARQQLSRREGIGLLEADGLAPVAQGMRCSLREHVGLTVLGEHVLQLPLLGDFNVDNALAAIGVMRATGISLDRIVAAMASVSAPPGRMESVFAAGRPLTIVDYAHTPDALDKALQAARRHCAGRLSLVFGCGGERDQGKRALMGEVAARSADQIILTDDNPRSERPSKIIDDILQGMPAAAAGKWRVIHDRREAIRAAVQVGTEGDVVLVAGKGHEDYQWIGERRLAASDRQWVREALQS